MRVQHGVQNAINRRDAEGLMGRISPVFKHSSDPSRDWENLVEKVEFDVAVTESSAKQGGGGAGLEILSIAKIEAKGQTKIERSAVNRVKFSVPVLFAAQLTDPKI